MEMNRERDGEDGEAIQKTKEKKREGRVDAEKH